MVTPADFFAAMKNRGISFFAGVPDSLLKHFCTYLDRHCLPDEHIITANEGNAVGLAAGYHLSTGQTGAVYMQNSGLGNCVNPLTSLTDLEVYSVPLLLIIGWRGEPGIQDEPQHIKQGRITPGQLELLEIPYHILDADSDLQQVMDDVCSAMHQSHAPAALLVRKGSFASSQSQAEPAAPEDALYREQALSRILDLAQDQDLFISTTGKTSRELFELRASRGEKQRDFLTVGSMGHTSSIALGAALGRSHRRVICLDGDGSAIMHLGAVPVIGQLQPANFIHIILNNCAHESVGGQSTVAGTMDWAAIAKACSYQAYRQAYDLHSLQAAWQELSALPGPQMLEIRIKKGSRADLGRPDTSPAQNKLAFMEAADE